jgi:hypothetical protein
MHKEICGILGSQGGEYVNIGDKKTHFSPL